MANVMRWRYGDTNPVMMQVDSDTEIEIGDLLFVESDAVKPAGELADQGDLGDNQALFHDQFVGVAMQYSPVGADDPIRVASTGVFEFACPLGTFEVGDLIGPAAGQSGATLSDQAVDEVGGIGLAIGRCVRRVAPEGTKALVDIVSTLVKGGPQAAA